MSRLTNTTNMVMKSEISVKTTPRSLTLEDNNMCVSHTLRDKVTQILFQKWGLENYILHVLKFVNGSKGS